MKCQLTCELYKCACLIDFRNLISVTIGKSFFSTHHDDHEATTVTIKLWIFSSEPNQYWLNTWWLDIAEKGRCCPPWGEGLLNKCLYGEAQPGGQTLHPFKYHFSRKRYPFCIPSIDKWYPFHIPCLELCIPFKCCRCTVFQIGINHKNRTFFQRLKALKFIC